MNERTNESKWRGICGAFGGVVVGGSIVCLSLRKLLQSAYCA